MKQDGIMLRNYRQKTEKWTLNPAAILEVKVDSYNNSPVRPL